MISASTPIKPMKSSPLFRFPDFTNPKFKRVLLACIALAAYIAWTLGAWEAFLIETGLRPKLRPTVLLAGDSLTEKGTNPKSNGWVTLLQHDYARSANVVPRGLSGYNTRWYLKYAMPVIRGEISSGTYNPVLITLWLGANDAALANGSNSEQHVPIENYRQNLIKIVREFQALAVDARIILITPPYVDDLARHRRAMKNDGDKHGIVDRTNEMTRSYAQVCVETAHKLGLPVVDLFSYFNDMPRWRRNNLLEDGLHLNTRGNKLMYDQLLDKIKDEFPEVVRKLERWQLPNFNRLVESDPWIPDEETSESSYSTDSTNSTRTLRSD